MERPRTTQSPFLQQEPIRLGFGTVMLLLLTVVGAGVGLLIYYALRVPAIVAELNAWLGIPVPVVDSREARQAQVIFAILVYTAPLGLGIFVYVVHVVVNWFDKLTRDRRSEEDANFEME